MREAPSVDLTFLAVCPNRSRDKGRRVLDLLLSEGGIYEPEECEIWKGGEKYSREKFSEETSKLILDQWMGLHGPFKGFNLIRRKPYQAQFVAMLNDYVDFDSFSLHVEKSYLKESLNLQTFRGLGQKLYSVLHPAFGQIGYVEMMRKMTQGTLEFYPGINLVKQGIPDLKWATFFGSEYVDMLSRERVLSAPCHEVKELEDGGILMILTEHLFDYDHDAFSFDKKRDEIRRHLGVDAFYMGDNALASRFPNFRFWNDRLALIRKSTEAWKMRGKS